MKLLTPRWLFGHLLALSLIGLFISFGFWQLRRLGQRDTANALLESRLTAEPQPFGELSAQYDLDAPADAENAAAYRRADALKRLYKLAREAGCIGADRAATAVMKKEGQ